MKRLFSLVVALIATQLTFAAVKEITVTSVEDDYENPAKGTLRWACAQASATTSVEITFDISGSGSKVIQLSDQITISGDVTIDASSSADSIIIDGDRNYCFYLYNNEETKLSLKGLSLKSYSTSGRCIGNYTYDDSEYKVTITAESCTFYSSLYIYGGTLTAIKSHFYSTVYGNSHRASLNFSECVFHGNSAQISLSGSDEAKLKCEKTPFLREEADGTKPIDYYPATTYTAPKIDTAYVANGQLYVIGSVTSAEVVEVELYSSFYRYTTGSYYNHLGRHKYLGTIKSKSDGTFSAKITYPETGLMAKQHFTLSATACYGNSYTSALSYYDVNSPYWVVNTTRKSDVTGYDASIGTMEWATEYAGSNDTIVFDFEGKGTRNFERYITTSASVDGSTYADTIIFHGLGCRSANKLVSENAGNGFEIQKDITNCTSRNNTSGIMLGTSGINVRNCVIENCSNSGITSYHGLNCKEIKNTVIRNNSYFGINCGANLIENCDVINNGIGIKETYATNKIDTIRGCWIAGNDSTGIFGSISVISDNIIGLTKDQKQPMPNSIGIEAHGYGPGLIINNVISGNKYHGISVACGSGAGGGDSLGGNYIGTNKYLDVDPLLGNGGDGVYESCFEAISNNYFMNNRGAGMSGRPVDSYRGLKNCVFSNNGTQGLLMNGGYPYGGAIVNCQFNDNGEEGILVDIDSRGGSIAIESCQFSRNGSYGIKEQGNTITISNTLFDANKESAIRITGTSHPSSFSENQFINTTKFNASAKAIEYNDTASVWESQILSIKRIGDDIQVLGESNAIGTGKIELFVSDGPETAVEFVDSVRTAKDGSFKFLIPRTKLSKYNSKICATVTTTNNHRTGALSEILCCDNCLCTSDTTTSGRLDTIYVGQEFLGKTYTNVGRHENIYETLQNTYGCDSVVKHTLFVKPDSTVKNYYVKTRRWGTGDGSTWDNAMDSIDFATYLPLVPDGTTFYVAEGTYKPVYNSDLEKSTFTANLCYTINGSVTIRGGYPDNATGTKVSSDPKKYLTIFDADIIGDDVAIESSDDTNLGILNEFGDDNAYDLFRITSPKPFDVTFDGVMIKHSYNGIISYANSSGSDTKSNLSCIEVTFENIYRSAIDNFATNSEVNIDNSLFKGNGACVFSSSYGNVNNNVNITNTEFTHNIFSGNIVDADGMTINIDKCNFHNNITQSNLIKAGITNINHSRISNNKTDAIMIYSYSEKNIFLNSDTIEGNVGNKIVMSSKECSIDSCEFKKNNGQLIYSANDATITNTKIIENVQEKAGDINDCLILLPSGGTLRRVTIQDNTVNLILTAHTKEIIDECYIDGNTANTILEIRPSNFNLRNSTISNNHVSGYIIQVHSSSNEEQALVQNNTIVNNESDGSIFYGYYSDNKYYNNTILGNTAKKDLFEQFHYYSGDGTEKKSGQFLGNIVFGNTYDKIFSTNPSIKDGWLIKNNILPLIFLRKNNNIADFFYDPKDNIISDFYFEDLISELTFEDEVKEAKNHLDDITSLFAGSYDPTTGLFTPELVNDDKSFAPIVPLKSDRLPDGTSIRFPLTETTVTTDQRGETRIDPTCMGAYELMCNLSIIQTKDTILIGDKYTFNGVDYGSSITVPGNYHFADTIKTAMGCDSILTLDLYAYAIDTTQTTATICLGTDYTLDGWNIQSAEYGPGIHTFYRKLDLEHAEELTLEIVKTTSVSIEEMEVTPPFCPGGRYGQIEFVVIQEDETENINIALYDGKGNALSSTIRNNYLRASQLPADNYQVRITASESDKCFKDTTFDIVMKDGDSMRAIGVDTLYTSCTEKPNASTVIELQNYHPSFGLRLDGKVIKRYGRTPNCILAEGKRKGNNYTATLKLDSLSVGNHTISVSDYCGNRYDICTFTVIGPEPSTFEILSMDGQLKCSDNYGSITLRRSGFEGNIIELASDKFKETYTFEEDATDMTIADLPGGEYTLHITNGDKSCPDGHTEKITIKQPQPLNVDLMVNGIVCQDAVITAYATGENEDYTYTWIKPDGEEITTSSNTLANVGAGKYKCIVKDSQGCSTAEGEAVVSELKNLSELKLLSATQDESCFGSDNAEIVVIYYDNNEHQAVTCKLTNKNTGEVVKSITSMLYWGGFYLKGVHPGDYTISLRYGTEDCNLDLNEVTKDITVKAKAKPLVIGTPTVKNVTCLSKPNGQIDFDVTGWEKGYTAEFASSKAQPVSVSADSTAHFTFNNISKGEYLFRVNDDCKEKEEAITIKVNAIEPYELSIDPVKTSLLCAKSNDGEVTLNISGGNHGNAALSCEGVLDETIIEQDGPMSLTNLTKGNYTVTYRSTDNTCPDKESLDFTIEAPDELEAKFSISGLGCDNMRLTASVTGEEKPYRFHWKMNGKMSLITYRSYYPFTLNMGDSITCIVWSENGCDTIEQTIRIPKEEEMPDLTIASKAKQERCYNGNDAEISVTTSIAQRLSYSVPVTIGLKMDGDKDFQTVNIVTNRTASHVFKDLAAGTYIVKSHFGTEGCSAGFVTVYDTVEVEPLHKMSTLAMEKHDRTCLNENNGYVAFTIDGWSDSHKAWTTNEVSLLGMRISIPSESVVPSKVEGQTAYFKIDAPAEGKNISIWVRDVCGNNFKTQPQKVEKLVSEYSINPLLARNEVDCNYTTDAWIVFGVRGGYPEANTFYMDGDEENAQTLTSSKLIPKTNLGVGTYTFRYKSTVENCTDEASYQFNVKPRNPLSFNTLLEGEECKDRKIVAEVTGGNTPIEVAWYSEKNTLIKKDQGVTYELQGVGAGVFHYTITDAKGCEYTSDEIPANLYNPEDDNLEISNVKADSTSCPLSEDGLVSVTYAGNDYQSDLFVILQGDGISDTIRTDKAEGTVDFQDLPNGEYQISLRYAAAGTCPTNSNAEQSIKVFSPKELEVSLMAHNAVCDTVHGGSISAIIQGGTPAYTVAWFQSEGESRIPMESHTSESKDTLRGLAIKNSYFCEITDKNGCTTSSDTITIKLQPMPDLDAISIGESTVEDESCYHGNNGSVSVAYANNTTQSPLKLILHNEKGEPSAGISGNSTNGSLEAQGLAPGDYTLYLDVDLSDNGCESSLSPRLLGTIHVEAIKEPLSVKGINVTPPTCLTKPNGKVSFLVNGWSDKDTASLTIAGERTIYLPNEVDGESALFVLDSLKSGDLTITVSDVCGNTVSKEPAYGGITEFGLKKGLTYTDLKCSYSTNGFAEIEINGGVKDSLYLCMFSVKNNVYTSRDTVMNPSGTVRFDNLEPNDFRFHLYTSVKNCPDAAAVGVIVKAPEPIVFDKAIEPVVCENTRSGEINFIPHRRGETMKYDNMDLSNNLIDEIYFGEYDEHFPHVTSISITGKGLTDLEMDTIMKEAISYGSYQGNGNFDYDEDDDEGDDDEEVTTCEREVDDLCVAPKKDPITSLWKEKDGKYQYPTYWVGLQSLVGTTYYVKVTDDSACVFIDSFSVLPPNYKTLSIDNVSYDANTAMCNAEKRRVEIEVSGGWGDYQYIFQPDHETADSSGLADSQTYIAGDSTWYKNGKGFYRSYILDPDKYTIIVMDKKGCKKQHDQKIDIRANVMIGGRSMADPCGSDSTNMIKVKATHSSWYADYSPYEYQLRFEDTSLGERQEVSAKTDSVTLYDVPTGKIGVFVYDKNGCSGYTNIVVRANDNLFEYNVSTLNQTDARCHNEPSGSLLFNVMGANPPYRNISLDGEVKTDYEVMHIDEEKKDTIFSSPDEKGFHMFDSILIKGLLGGEHILTIVDSLGCQKDLKFTVKQPEELTLSISASSVCPDGEEGRIVADKTAGGTSPYEYSLEQESGFTDKQFLGSKLGVERSMYVRDANGCVAKSSNTATVDASINWGDVKPDVLVSSWQDFDDVLAFIDVTTYDDPGNKIKYDSATVKPYGIEVLNNGKAADSIQFEVVDPAIYTYGIPDSIEYILLWNQDTIWGPSWGVPSDIAAGVRSQEEYTALKIDIDARKKKLNDGLEKLIKDFKKKENPTASETDKFLADSTAFALSLDSIRSEERQNCTIGMIKSHFKELMNESVVNRMTFVHLQSSIHNIESLYDGDSLLFRYNFVHTVYLSNCDLSTDYNFSSESLYGIRVSEQGFNPYKEYAKRDIIEFDVSPNPASSDEECSIYLVLSRKTNPSIMVHNMIGKEQQNSLNIPEPEEVTEEDGIVYRYNITGLKLASSAVITVRTDRDAASKVVIVN